MPIVGAVDMGASGPRAAVVEITGGAARLGSEVRPLKNPSRLRSLVKSLRKEFDGIDAIGVSIAAALDPSTGSIIRSGPYPWVQGPLGAQLADELGCTVRVVNDAEAHLLAHVGAHAHPLLCLALGSGLGFAATDATGAVQHPRPDACWELGHVLVGRPGDDTERRRNDAVWLLGAAGLTAAQQTHGVDAGADTYADDVGLFVYNLSRIFQPRTVVLAGGITASLDPKLQNRVAAVVDGLWPAHSPWERPDIVASPHGTTSGLIGAAVAVADLSDRP